MEKKKRRQAHRRQQPSTTPNPTIKHLHILLFIYECSKQGNAPTIREIGQAIGMRSTSVVNYNLGKLVQWGYIDRSHKRTRSVGLTETGYQILGKPSPQSLQDEVLRLRCENQFLRAECERLQNQHLGLVLAS